VLAGVSYEEQEDAGFGAAVINLIIIPALWVGNSALVFWVIRLFVMYDPKKRKAWGRYINEKRMARGLCWAYAGMEAALWVAAAVFGFYRWLARDVWTRVILLQHAAYAQAFEACSTWQAFGPKTHCSTRRDTPYHSPIGIGGSATFQSKPDAP